MADRDLTTAFHHTSSATARCSPEASARIRSSWHASATMCTRCRHVHALRWPPGRGCAREGRSAVPGTMLFRSSHRRGLACTRTGAAGAVAGRTRGDRYFVAESSSRKRRRVGRSRKRRHRRHGRRGINVADTLRSEGYGGRIVMISRETDLLTTSRISRRITWQGMLPRIGCRCIRASITTSSASSCGSARSSPSSTR